MNAPHDNAETDRDALEKHGPEAGHQPPHIKHGIPGWGPLPERGIGLLTGETAEKFDPTTGEVFDEDAPAGSGWDKERHCATDLRGADWAGRKLREAQEQIALNDAMAAAEIAELQRRIGAVKDRLIEANAPFVHTEELMENALRVFAETHRVEVLRGLRTKSRLLPSGVRIGWEKKRDGYFWDDSMKESERKAKLLAWADMEERTTGEELTKATPQPDLDAIKKHLAALDQEELAECLDGQLAPPGLRYVAPGQEELRIETGVPGVESKEEP